MTKTEYTIHYANGDSIRSWINVSPEEVRKIFRVGSFQNAGMGPYDDIQQIVSVEIHHTKEE